MQIVSSGRQFAWNVKAYFLGKNDFVNLLPSELTQQKVKASFEDEVAWKPIFCEKKISVNLLPAE